MKTDRISNYEIMKNQVQQRFIHYNHEEMIQKFSLESDEEYLHVFFVSRKYRIHRITGEVFWFDKTTALWNPAGFNEVLTIFDVLCDSKADCKLSGEYTTLQRLSSLQNGSTGVLGGSFYDRRAASFDLNREKLDLACRKLGGKPYFKGDLAYEIPLFPFLPMVFQFWFADEEFPASMEFFMDKNVLQYMRFETLWYAAGHLLERIQEEM